VRVYLAALAGLLAISACSPVKLASPQVNATSTRLSQARSQDLKMHFVTAQDIPRETLQTYQNQAQDYADLVSRRRKIDFFQLHANPVGLSVQWADHQAHILSWMGTAKTRNDLNLELRLFQGENNSISINLNYSGPITRSLETEQSPSQVSSKKSDQGISFELIMGLPGESVTQAYSEYLEQLAKYLPYRYQARPFAFDDGPLIYAVTADEHLLGFVFCNQRNYLVLGERKYADVQNLVMIAPNRKILGAYTLIAFNPKTDHADISPDLKISEHPDFGHMIELGAI